MDQLWGIALRAQSADISRAAIQYINSYYINGWSELACVSVTSGAEVGGLTRRLCLLQQLERLAWRRSRSSSGSACKVC